MLSQFGAGRCSVPLNESLRYSSIWHAFLLKLLYVNFCLAGTLKAWNLFVLSINFVYNFFCSFLYSTLYPRSSHGSCAIEMSIFFFLLKKEKRIRTRPRALVQNQHTKDVINARNKQRSSPVPPQQCLTTSATIMKETCVTTLMLLWPSGKHINDSAF